MLQVEEEAADAAFLASEEEDGGAHPGKRVRKEQPARRRRPEEATYESAGGSACEHFALALSFIRLWATCMFVVHTTGMRKQAARQFVEALLEFAEQMIGLSVQLVQLPPVMLIVSRC